MDFDFERKESYSYEDVQGLLSRFVQSETDKVRTEYSKRLKSVQEQLDSVKPKEKTEAEKALDKRQAELDQREKLLNCKAAGIPEEFAAMFSPDADFEKLGKLFAGNSGYIPQDHRKSDGMTKDEWNKLDYSAQAELFAKNPELAKQFI